METLDTTIADSTVSTRPRPRPILHLETAKRHIANALADGSRQNMCTSEEEGVVQTLMDATIQGWGSCARWQSAIYAACTTRGHVRVWIETRAPRRRVLPYPLPAHKATSRTHATAWADQATEGLLLSRRVAAQWVMEYRRLERAEGRKYLLDVPDVRVTLADSIAAGNCPDESQRVAAWFAGGETGPCYSRLIEGVESVRARELLELVRFREPKLLRFARAAVDYVHARRTHADTDTTR